MDVEKSFTSDLGVLQRKMASFAGVVAFETFLAAQISLACLVMTTGFLLHDAHTLASVIGSDRSLERNREGEKGKRDLPVERRRWQWRRRATTVATETKGDGDDDDGEQWRSDVICGDGDEGRRRWQRRRRATTVATETKGDGGGNGD
ncbi:hypothetical protein Ccrd_004188, partial [Cynara cardunculus var. scolymus]